MTFPDTAVSLLQGKTLQINDTAIPLPKHRLQVIVDKDGLITVTSAPVSGLSWNSLEYIRQLSSQLTSNQAAATHRGHQSSSPAR